MLELVTGGSGSGKSAYAENRICELNQQNPAPLFYIATMYPYGAETQKKIERHRIQRAGKGFETLEWYTGLEEHLENTLQEDGALEESSLKGCNVLLECMSNLVANELYMETGAKEQTEQAILAGIRKLQEQCANVVIVTNEVFSESVPDTVEMKEYKRILGRINCEIARMADQVTEVIYGLPQEKKEENCNSMKIILGGAFQGKTAYAKKQNPSLDLTDGEKCSLDSIDTCQAMNSFHSFTRRWLKDGRTKGELQKRIKENPSLQLLISDEIGYGLVPIDDFEREYREFHGRVMTELVQNAETVVRIVCGIPQVLKGGNNECFQR